MSAPVTVPPELTPFEVEVLRLCKHPSDHLEWEWVHPVRCSFQRFDAAFDKLIELGLIDREIDLTDAGRQILTDMRVTW